MATSPNFDADKTLFVGTLGDGMAAVHISCDGGESFERFVEHETPSPWISLAIPGSYRDDHRYWLFATASQVFRPAGRFRDVWSGTHPAARDTAVLSVATTPTFGDDETLFVATSQGVFRSSNGGAAWEEVNFGLENHAVLKVAISPDYAEDHLAFAMSLGGEIWRFIDQPETRRIAERKPTDIV